MGSIAEPEVRITLTPSSPDGKLTSGHNRRLQNELHKGIIDGGTENEPDPKVRLVDVYASWRDRIATTSCGRDCDRDPARRYQPGEACNGARVYRASPAGRGYS